MECHTLSFPMPSGITVSVWLSCFREASHWKEQMKAQGEPSMSPSISSSSSPGEIWASAFNKLSQQIRSSFIRLESHQQALRYMRGLMSPIERKNGWQVAEEVGQATPYAMQHLLDRAKWDCDQVRDALRTYIWETLAGSNAVVVIDETGFLKKGYQSVGVQRQYSGTAGRIENCQVGVFLSYASPRGHALLDRELYLPKSWTDDQERCRDAHVPASVIFATKPELAQRMLERTLDSGLPVTWVTGDTVYGSSQKLRAGLEARKQAYALAVTCKEQVEVQGTRRRVDQVASTLTREEWQESSAGAGSKGPRLFAWARMELAAPEASGWQRWLLVRRCLDEGVKPAEMAYVLVFAPAGTPLQEMVDALGMRWTVEQCFEEGKGEVGLDEYEVRSWHGWYRHVTLSMLAQAFLTGLQARDEEDARPKKPEPTPQTPEPEATDSVQAHVSSDPPVMVSLSVAEIRRLFFRLVDNPSFPFAYHLAWSFWRRIHQAIARLCHYKRRSAISGHLQL
jgi:SRSO17 transposase